MEVDLDRDDIIKEMDNYRDEPDFLYDIVDSSTIQWQSIRDLVDRLLDDMNLHNELGDLENKFKEL